jgi:hypothetical protein
VSPSRDQTTASQPVARMNAWTSRSRSVTRGAT